MDKNDSGPEVCESNLKVNSKLWVVILHPAAMANLSY